jgi:hypothetical protein
VAGALRDAPDRLSVRSSRWNARPLAWGLGAAALYVLVVVASQRAGLLPVRPLYDGLMPPPPYRYVNPPIDFIRENQPALAGTAMLRLTDRGSEPGSAATNDGQAVVTFAPNTVAPRAGEDAIFVTLTPLDPRRIVPGGLRDRADGNAYRVEVVYAASRAPVVLQRPITVVLRYPVHATEIYQEGTPDWQALPTTYFPTSFVVYAETRRAGTFVATAPPGYFTGLAAVRRRPLSGVLLPGLALLAALVGLIVVVVARLRARRAAGPRR